MRHQGPSGEADPHRDPLLEAAFAHFVQQAQAPTEFAARVRARAMLRRAEGWSQSWLRRVITRLVGVGEPWGRSGVDIHAGGVQPRITPGRVRIAVLVTCLVLSVLGNVWFGVHLVGKEARLADTDALPSHTRGAAPGAHGRVRLAFADEVREQDLRTLLLSLRATILAGPSPQGVYLVQVPLDWLVPRTRGSSGTLPTPDPMSLLLEELRAHPAVRLAEPVTPAD